MQKWLNGFVLIVGFLLVYTQAKGQINHPAIAFETIGGNKGLSHHLVYSVYQDKRGFIWAGTDYGLNMYNGLSFIHHFANADGRGAIPHNHVNRMAEDADGNIWVGTNRGISRYNPLTRQSRHFFTHEKDRITFKDLGFQVFADRKSNIWAGNGYFLFRYRQATGTFSCYPMDGGQSTGNTRNYFLLDLLEDKNGGIWLATSYGIKKFDTLTGSYKSYHFAEQGKRLVENAITSLAEAPDGALIAGTWGEGLLRYNPGRDCFEKIPYQLEEVGHRIIMDIAFSGNKIYLATGAGLLSGTFPQSLSALQKSNWTCYQPNKGNDRSLSGNVVFGLLLDKLSNLWLATNNNISRADLRMSHFQHQKAVVAANTEILPNVLLAAGPSSAPGSFWLGSDGLYFGNTLKKDIEKMPVDRFIHNTEGQIGIWDMSYGKKGIWLATTGGLLQFDQKTQKVTKAFYHVPGNKNSLAGERLWKVHEDKSGKVWVATIRQGISMLHPSTGSIRNFFGEPNEKASLFNKTTTDFWEDSKGNTWFGSDNMLYCYHKTADTFQTIPFLMPQKGSSPLTGKPNPFYEDINHNIWLSTSDGIITFNPEKKVFNPILTGVRFFNPAGEITMDSGGDFWFGTTNGLFRWDTANNKLTRFTTNDGLLSNEMDGCITQLENGFILSGSPGAITYFLPQNLLAKEPSPPVAISSVQVNGSDTSIQFENPPLLPHQSTLYFSYAALSYGNASQNQYSYMLKGTDKDWNPATQNTTVTYAKLPAGKYTFMVKGSNSDGVWNPDPAIFSFRIEAPFYLKGWFIIMALVVFAGSLFLFYRYRLKQALKVERLRTRLATDLHDDVGATLSAISMYSDALKKQVEKPQLVNLLEKMGEDSREMVRTMSDLVWAINPKNDGGEKLLQRMENYATDLCASKDVTLHFSSVPAITAHTIGIETRRNIYLIFKEAITNALKYAGCSHLNVSFSTTGSQLIMTIQDNGKGFDAAVSGTGNGLGNMQTRATEINGKLIIDASPGNGCTIQLTCPL